MTKGIRMMSRIVLPPRRSLNISAIHRNQLEITRIMMTAGMSNQIKRILKIVI